MPFMLVENKSASTYCFGDSNQTTVSLDRLDNLEWLSHLPFFCHWPFADGRLGTLDDIPKHYGDVTPRIFSSVMTSVRTRELDTDFVEGFKQDQNGFYVNEYGMPIMCFHNIFLEDSLMSPYYFSFLQRVIYRGYARNQYVEYMYHTAKKIYDEAYEIEKILCEISAGREADKITPGPMVKMYIGEPMEVDDDNWSGDEYCPDLDAYPGYQADEGEVFNLVNNISELTERLQEIPELLVVEEEQENTLRVFVFNTIKRTWDFTKSLASTARDIGISAVESIKDLLNTLLNMLRPIFGTVFNRVFEIISDVFVSFFSRYVTPYFNGVEAMLCSTMACIIAGLAAFVPRPLMGTFARIALAAIAFLVYRSKSYMGVGIGAFILYIIKIATPATAICVDIQNHNHVKPQGEILSKKQEDVKNLIVDIGTLAVLFQAGTAGLDLPHDGPSWEKMFRRHVLLHKGLQSWEFCGEKVISIFENIVRFVMTYYFKKDYVSMKYIPEIEALHSKVADFSTLANQSRIGKDPKMTQELETTYLEYLRLRKVYTGNRYIMDRLSIIGAPLTSYFMKVSEKNPKANVMRREPVGIMIHGETGIGKSHLLTALQLDLLKICGKFDPDGEMEGTIYSRCIEQEYWDGYFGQSIVIFDDFGQRVDSPSTPNNEFFEVIRTVNIFPYNPHMAHLNDKANTTFGSDFVVMTSNLATFKPTSIISAEAFSRRLHIPVTMIIDAAVDVNGVGPNHVYFKQRLSLEKLRKYREENNLPEHDNSHIKFKYNDKILSYEEFVVLISEVYDKNDKSFQQRKDNFHARKDHRLPVGAKSVDARWVNEDLPETQPDERAPSTCPNSDGEDTVDVPCDWDGDTDSTWYRTDSDVWHSSVEPQSDRYIVRRNERKNKCFYNDPDEELFVPEENGYVMVEPSYLMNKKEEVSVMMMEAMNKATVFGEHVLNGYLYRTHAALVEISEHFRARHLKLFKCLKLIGVTLTCAVLAGGIVSYFWPSVEKVEENVVVAESPMKVAATKSKAKFESPMKVVNTKTRARFEDGLERLLVDAESGRGLSGGTTHKPRFEGISSEQCEVLSALVEGNMWALHIRIDETQIPIGLLTVLAGRKAIINYHYLQMVGKHLKEAKDPSSLEIVFLQPNQEKGHVTSFRSILTGARKVKRGEDDTEFYIIDMPATCHAGRDITGHLISAEDCGKLGRGISLRICTQRRQKNTFKYSRTRLEGPMNKIETVTMIDLMDSSTYHEYPNTVHYSINTAAGDCGSPVLINNNSFNRKILGFHFAGQPSVGMCSIITRDDVLRVFNPKQEFVQAEPQSIRLCEVDFPMPDTSFFPCGRVQEEIKHSVRTTLEPSLVQGCFGDPETLPAKLAAPLTPDGPMMKALMKNAEEVRVIEDEGILNKCVEDYFRSNVAPYVPTSDERRVLTFEEACAGINGNDFFPPIKRSKSAGYPFMASAKKGKTDWFGSENSFDFSSEKCKELKRVVKQMEKEAQEGVIPEACFVATLKDEKRSVAKVEAGETRVFSACPMHYLILFRKYFSGYIAFMTRNKIVNESAIGTNVHGTDWNKLVTHLRKWSKFNILAGDFKNFDGTFHPQIFDKVCVVINQFYADSPQNQRVRTALWHALRNPLHILGPYVFHFSHGQPSGSPITAISNSVYVSLSARYALYRILASLQMKFSKHVRMVAYGDDSLIAVSPEFASKITPLDVAKAFKDIGMNYTDADKQQITEYHEYEPIESVSFLKRSFVFDESRKHWFAPLDLKSIREMCNWVRKSESVENATISNCEDALKELCHHEEENFLKYLNVLNEQAHHKSFFLTVPDWNTFRDAMSLDQVEYTSEGRSFV